MAFSVCARSARAYSPTTSLVLEGLMFLVMPEPSIHSPAMKFLRMADMCSSGVSCLSYEAGTLVVKGPAGNQELHGDGVVARAEPVLLVQRVRGLDRAAIDLDAEARAV